ncbi:MAG: hypothetical protein Q4E26_00990 [Prevotellaceae bacterium]|nr:hypothetical protein [Prevotellaceae bacterium]
MSSSDMVKRKYQKPFIYPRSCHIIPVLAVSDNVGLIIGGGSNASKFGYYDLWGDDEEECYE